MTGRKPRKPLEPAMLFTRLVFVSSIMALGTAPAFAATCTVSVAGDDQVAAAAPFSSLAPGATVCIAPGTYRKTFVIAHAHGSAGKPLTFVADPAGGAVTLLSGLLLRDASWVVVSGLAVRLDPRAGPGSAVTLDVGTHHSTITGMTVDDAYVGIAIGSSAGAAGVGNDIDGNVVRGSWNTGIGVAPLSDGTQAEPNRIRRNQVIGSGGHGIEINAANHASIEDNVVTGNGTGVNSIEQGGYSGIHFYSTGPTSLASEHQLRCAYNAATGNTVTGTQERPGKSVCRDGSGSGRCADGNGIQVDRFCAMNAIVSNHVSGNAGDGISIYGAAGNTVRGNIVSGNNQQVDRTEFLPGAAEIAVSAVNLPANSAPGNSVSDNTATTTVHRVPAFYQSPGAGSNTIGPGNRWYWSQKSGPGWTWSPVVLGEHGYRSGEDVDQATGTSRNAVGTP